MNQKDEIIKMSNEERLEIINLASGDSINTKQYSGFRSARSCGCGNLCTFWVNGVLISGCDGAILEIR